VTGGLVEVTENGKQKTDRGVRKCVWVSVGILADKIAGVRSGVRFVPETVRLDSEGAFTADQYDSSYSYKIWCQVGKSAARCGEAKFTFRVRCLQSALRPSGTRYPSSAEKMPPGRLTYSGDLY
jgi:hypothetical protein